MRADDCISIRRASPDNKEDELYLWGNTEVRGDILDTIATSGEWHKLNDIEGFFSAIYKRNEKSFLFCDRFGIYPLYYATAKKMVCAAPSVPELFEKMTLQPTPSTEGILSLLLFGHHLADETIFEEIRRCQGGEVLEYGNDGRRILATKWRKSHTYDDSRIDDDMVHRLSESFVDAVASAVTGVEKIIIPLSGGFDSRAVLGAVLECVEADRIQTVTFGGKDTLDYRLGELIARKVGVDNVLFPIKREIFEKGYQGNRASTYNYGYSAFATQPAEILTYLEEMSSEGYPSIWGAGGDAITGSHLNRSDLLVKPCENFESLAGLLIEKRAYAPLKEVTSLLGLAEVDAIHIIANLLKRSTLDYYKEPWEFLDAWDIFVRGRMELISVLPFPQRLWWCPHFSRDYFDMIARQGFYEKVNQNCYRRMLISRYKSLFSLPTKRLGGRSLVSPQGRHYIWILSWQAARLNKVLSRLTGSIVDTAARNYGKDQWYLNTAKGRKRLHYSINILSRRGILRQKVDTTFKMAQRNTQLARILITVGYAFEG